MMGAESAGAAFASFFPLLITGLVIAAFAWPMTKRKGLATGYALLCIIPFIGILILVWIASQPDRDLLDRLAKLEARE